MQRNHPKHYIPIIVLTSDQGNNYYIFKLTDEKRNTITYYNNENEISLEDTLQFFLRRHELKQDNTRAYGYTKFDIQTNKRNNKSHLRK